MGRMITTARYVPDPVPIKEIYRGDGKTELVTGIDAFEFKPRKPVKKISEEDRRRKPEWIQALIVLSAVLPQIYCVLFFAHMSTHPGVFAFIAVSSQAWAWTVLIANCVGGKKKNRSSRCQNGPVAN